LVLALYAIAYSAALPMKREKIAILLLSLRLTKCEGALSNDDVRMSVCRNRVYTVSQKNWATFLRPLTF